MQFEKLKRSYKKQIIMGALAICIVGGALTFATTRAKFKLTQSIDLVKGTINYKPYDFKIMAMYKSDDGTNYTEVTDRMPSDGYIINESKSYCTLDNKTKDTEAVLKTVNGIHGFSNLKKTDKCYLYFDKKTSVDNVQDLVAKVQSEAKTTTPDFSSAATPDEGVYAVSDGMYGGTSYYWRGAVTNNYVKFAGYCWRIVRINGDKTLRLIYDGTTCHANGTSTAESIAVTSQAYNSSYNRSEYVGWTYEEGNQRPTSINQRTVGGSSSNERDSNIKAQTESWYSSNITGTNATKVADGKYCNDRNTASGYSWSSQPSSTFYYAGCDRSGAMSASSVTPTLSCPSGDVYTLKVGLITMDEVIMAGAKLETGNSNYYLYNGQSYWTMSPYCWFYFNSAYQTSVFFVYSNGKLSDNYVHNPYGIRPVINLKSDTQFQAGGIGTLDNPYVVLSGSGGNVGTDY